MTPAESLPILVVEDSSDDFEAAQRAFRKAGVTSKLKHMCSGEEALEYLQAAGKPRPSIILLDLNMPGIGGRKTLEIIKNDESLKSIPVVVLTTSNYEVDVNMCYALGANSYIQKPVDFTLFSRAMSTLAAYWLDTTLLPQPPGPRAG